MDSYVYPSCHLLSAVVRSNDLKEFQKLFVDYRNRIVNNCFHADSDSNVLLQSLRQSENDIAGFLLDQESILSRLLHPMGADISTTKDCLTSLAETGRPILVAKLITKGEAMASKVTQTWWFKAEKECSLNMFGEIQKTSLNCVEIAAMKGHFQLIKQLRKFNDTASACKKVSPKRNFTALMLASRFGHVEAVRQLLKWFGIGELVKRGYRRFTALHFAVCYDHRQVVKVILEATVDNGSNMTTGGYLGYPIVFAAALKHELIGEILSMYEQEMKKKQSPSSSSLLPGAALCKTIHAAAAVVNPYATRMLLSVTSHKQQNSANYGQYNNEIVECMDADGHTPLMVAAYAGDVETVGMLVDLGANVTHRNKLGYTVWQFVYAPRNASKIVELLYRLSKITAIPLSDQDITDATRKAELAGINVYTIDANRNTFMHAAAKINQHQILDAFIPRYLTMTERTNLQGDTPLHVASAKGCLQSVRVLMRHTPFTVLQTNHRNATALHCASEAGHRSIVEHIAEILRNDDSRCDGQVFRQLVSNSIENGNTALHLAATAGHSDVIVKLLTYSEVLPTLLVRNANGMTPLHAATAGHHTKAVQELSKLLESNRECATIKDARGDTPLHIAALKGFTDTGIVKVLLEYPEALIEENSEGKTPLHHAAAEGHDVVVQCIIEAIQSNGNLGTQSGKTTGNLGAEEYVCKADRDGNTAMHLAARKGHRSTTLLFLQYPKCVVASNKQKMTPLHVAADEGRSVVVKEILEYFKSQTNMDEIIRIPDANGNTALHLAARRDNLVSVQLLCDRITLTLFNNRKQTALHVACDVAEEISAMHLTKALKDVEDVRKMLALEDADGQTVLHLAVSNGLKKVVRKLLLGAEDTAQVLRKNRDKRTVLHIAALHGDCDLTKIIFDRLRQLNGPEVTADERSLINAEDCDGFPALHLAARVGNTVVGKSKGWKVIDMILKQYPESLFAVDRLSRTVLQVAAETSNLQLINSAMQALVLCNHRKLSTTESQVFRKQVIIDYAPLFNALQHGNADIVQTILDYVSANSIYEGTMNCVSLHKVVSEGRCETMKLLLDAIRKDDIKRLLNEQDNDGNTPLHVSLSEGKVEMARQLLAYSPDLTLKNKAKYNALQTAAIHDQDAVVKLLIQKISESKKTELFKECCDEGTALHIAVRTGHVRCIEALLHDSASAARYVPDSSQKRLPLHYAATSNDPEVLRVYLSKSVRTESDLNTIDKHGRTALMYCVRRGDIGGFQLLVAHGADVYMTYGKGCNLMHYAIEQYQKRYRSQKLIFEMYKHLKQYNLHNKSCMCAVASKLVIEEATPLQLAAAVGAVKIVKDLVEEYHTVRLENGAVYRMPVIIPKSLYDEDKKMEEKTVSSTTTTEVKIHDNETSCIELILDYCNCDEITKMMTVKPFQQFLTKFARIRSIAFYVILLLHVTFMTCFSTYVLPTCSDVTWSQNDSVSTSRTSSTRKNAAFAGFLVWPLAVLLFEMLCFVKFCVAVVNGRSPKQLRNSLAFHKETTNGNKTINPCQTALNPAVFSGLSLTYKVEKLSPTRTVLHLLMQNLYRWFTADTLSLVQYINYFEAFAHFSSVLFSILVFSWFIMYSNLESQGRRNYVTIVAVIEIHGWLQTIEYLKAFPGIHTFSVMLKLIFIKDILRILTIYVFVLLGFSLALQAFILYDSSWIGSSTFPHTSYQLFGAMVGQSEMFDATAAEDGSAFGNYSTVVRLMFTVYVCISTIVLMNILVAMMNHTYDSVTELKNVLWCVEGLQFIQWVSRDDIMFIRSSCRQFSRMCVFDRNVKKELDLSKIPQDEPLMVNYTDTGTDENALGEVQIHVREVNRHPAVTRQLASLADLVQSENNGSNKLVNATSVPEKADVEPDEDESASLMIDGNANKQTPVNALGATSMPEGAEVEQDEDESEPLLIDGHETKRTWPTPKYYKPTPVAHDVRATSRRRHSGNFNQVKPDSEVFLTSRSVEYNVYGTVTRGRDA